MKKFWSLIWVILRGVVFPFALIWLPLRSLFRFLREAARDDPQAALRTNILNGYLNGHQAFRGIWLVVLLLAHPWLQRPAVNLQFLAGLVVLIAGAGFSEWRGRYRVQVRTREVFNFNIGLDFGPHFAASNLRITQYPIHAFLFDFSALALVMWGTGGVSSPFSQLLFFGAFAASFALHSPRRATVATCLAAVAFGIAVSLPYVFDSTQEPWRSAWQGRILWWDVAGLSVADGFFISAADHEPWAKLSFVIVVTAVFLLLSGVMAARAAREYNAALDNLPQRGRTENRTPGRATADPVAADQRERQAAQ